MKSGSLPVISKVKEVWGIQFKKKGSDVAKNYPLWPFFYLESWFYGA